jgi:5-methylthioadenosine/S-adenosylhomocysteine deaminase
MPQEQRALLLRGGDVITCDPELGTSAAADVLIENGRIAAVGPGLSAGDAQVIDAVGHIVMPGLIDTHRHVTDAVYAQISADLTLVGYFEATPGPYGDPDDDDLRRASRAGALLALDAGVTTVLDWSLSAQSLSAGNAALDGYAEAGGRVYFAYGPGAGIIGMDPDLEGSSIYEDTRTLRDRCTADETGLLNLLVAARGPEFTTLDIARQEIELARALGLSASMHVGGLTIGMHEKVMDLDAQGLLGPDLLFAHCCLLSEREMEAMAAAGTTASVSPFVEATIGIGPCAYVRLRDAGVVTGVSVDSVALAGHGLFAEARALLALERSVAHTATFRSRTDPSDNDFLTTDDVLQALTLEAARSIGMGDELGSITPGKLADLIMVEKRRLGTRPLNGASAVILTADAPVIDTVIVGGCVRKRGGALIDAAYSEIVDDLSEIRSRTPAGMQGIAWLP